MVISTFQLPVPLTIGAKKSVAKERRNAAALRRDPSARVFQVSTTGNIQA
jgi:hypothetical protein